MDVGRARTDAGDKRKMPPAFGAKQYLPLARD